MIKERHTLLVVVAGVYGETYSKNDEKKNPDGVEQRPQT